MVFNIRYHYSLAQNVSTTFKKKIICIYLSESGNGHIVQRNVIKIYMCSKITEQCLSSQNAKKHNPVLIDSLSTVESCNGMQDF